MIISYIFVSRETFYIFLFYCWLFYFICYCPCLMFLLAIFSVNIHLVNNQELTEVLFST